jgi:hypothetical protein
MTERNDDDTRFTPGVRCGHCGAEQVFAFTSPAFGPSHFCQGCDSVFIGVGFAPVTAEPEPLAVAEATIRNAAHLMASRLDGASGHDSYVAAYRVLFAYLYPGVPVPCEAPHD